MLTLFYTILTLSFLGALAAVILFYVVQKFYVEEDPRIDDVERMLPGANCGGCGFAGCRGFAVAAVEQDDISNLSCPVGGADTLQVVAEYLGKVPAAVLPQVATLKCGGCIEKRPRTNYYDGARSCSIASSLYIGESGCASGCLGFGDCVASCGFGAMWIDEESGLVEIDDELCVACGACVNSCPRAIIELRKKMPKNKAIYVACNSKEKGAKVMKSCKAGCIGCSKCAKVCSFEAITIQNNLAYISAESCKLCRKCVAECPTKAIVMVNLTMPKKAAKDSGSAKA